MIKTSEFEFFIENQNFRFSLFLTRYIVQSKYGEFKGSIAESWQNTDYC